MNPEQLLHWLNNPASLDNESLLSLRALVDDYPCFTTARMLYLKNLARLNDVHYTAELVRTAVSVPDRRKLYVYMEDRPESCLPGLKRVGAPENRDFSLIDRFLHHVSVQETDEDMERSNQYLKQTSQPGNPVEPLVCETGADASDDHFVSDSGTGASDESLVAEIPLNHAGQAVETEQTPAPDFVEDYGVGGFSLDYLHYQALYDERKAPAEQEAPAQPMKGQDLIDAYLSGGHERVEAGIQAPPHQAPVFSEEEALESLTSGLPEASFSEALARIYVKQKRYARALEIIKSLCLKYPEKNSYFAVQIRYLEQLINTTNQ